MKHKKKKIVVAVAGGFDPVHMGHIDHFREARKLGDELIVILNNDNWCRKKKGWSFMNEEERKEVVGAVRYVDRVVVTRHGPDPEDMSVADELKRVRPDIFAKGGDRTRADSMKRSSSLNRDREMCERLGIRMVFNVGKKGKIQSSSWLLKANARRANRKGMKQGAGRKRKRGK